jgi:hypothetical protein
VTAKDLTHRREPPKKVKMLVRDFVDDSLYNVSSVTTRFHDYATLNLIRGPALDVVAKLWLLCKTSDHLHF